MTEDVFVWDTTGLLYAQACDRLESLLDAAGPSRRHLVPVGVMEELRRHGQVPVEGRLEEWNPAELEKILVLVKWQTRIGSDGFDGKNSGEAWVAAAAEVEGAVAIVDDREARRVIEKAARSLEVHGVLWAISRGVQEGRVPTAQGYSGLCDQMLRAHEGHEFAALRWPFGLGGFAAWYDEALARGEL